MRGRRAFSGLPHSGRDFRDFLFAVRQKFVQRRIQEPDGHRPTGHNLEQFDEIGALHWQQLRDRRATLSLVIGENHFANRLDRSNLKKHVLGPAEPDALGAETHGGLCVRRCIGVGTHAKSAHLVGPADQS